MNELKNLLNISEKQQQETKIRKPKYYNKVKDNTLLVEDKNFMADLLHLPTTKQGYKYLFVVVDLATDEFDYEPLKTKVPYELVDAVVEINKRNFIKVKMNDGVSLRTDDGTEFKGTFDKFLYRSSILHRVARPNRHIQVANVESLNSTLGKLLNGYMNSKEEQTGKPYREWTDKIELIRTKLNEIRKKKLPDNIFTYIYPPWNGYIKNKSTKKTTYKEIPSKYKVGDYVHVALESPENALGEKQSGNFRNGDYRWTKEVHKILKVLYYSGKPYYRYIVNDFPNVSYQADELRPAQEAQQETYIVKKILNKRTSNKKIEYLVWWKGYKKNEATWEPAKQLIDDGLQDYIDDFEQAV